MKGEKDDSDPSYPTLGILFSTTSPTSTTKTDCIGPESLKKNTAITGEFVASGSSYAAPLIVDANFDASYSYMIIKAIPDQASPNIITGRVLIRWIEIIETSPFSLPQTISIACGATDSKTITVSNPQNIPLITEYKWDLGSSDNGWLYQGSPALQIISTGTTNSITLTPVAGRTPNNIKATVTANGINYVTNTSQTEVSQLPLTIQGPTKFCNPTGIYTINNLPNDAVVNWTVSPSGIATIDNANAHSITLTKIQNGNITLSASVSSVNCNSVQSPSALSVDMTVLKPSYVGIQSFSNLKSCDEPFGNFELLHGTSGYIYNGTLTVAGNNNTENITWNKYAGNSLIYHEDLGNGKVSVGTNYQNQEIYIRATATNVCGSHNQDYYVATKACGIVMIAPQSETEYLLSPNPTSDALTISALDPSPNVEKKGKKSPFTQVRISDVNGTVKRKAEFKTPQEKATILVADLPPGQYFAHVFNGKEWKSVSFVKK